MKSTSSTFADGIAPFIGHFKKSRPIIEIFIEDDGIVSRDLWENYLIKIVPKDYRLSFTSLSGRNRVIKEFEADNIDDGRRKLYIIDADMDILTGKPTSSSKYFYRLPVYCIENYLMEEENIEKLCKFLHTKGKINDYKEHFDYNSWKMHNKSSFKKLFACYALVQKLDVRIQNVNYGVYRLRQSSPNQDLLCLTKIRNRISQIHAELREFGYTNAMLYKNYKTIFGIMKGKCFMDFVDGKSHLLVLIHKRFENKKFAKIDLDLMKKRLSENISENIDPKLNNKIKNLCK